MKSMSDSERMSDGLKLVSTCPVCETRYLPLEARLLGRDGETHVFYVQCRKCQHSILAFVLIGSVGASSVGILTDLSYEDVLTFRSNTALSINDVIESHTMFDGERWSQMLGGVRKELLPKVRRKQKKLKE